MEQQKGSGYKIENIILIESSFQRKQHISFDGTPFNNEILIDKNIFDIPDTPNRFNVGLSFIFKAWQNEEIAFEIRIEMVGIFEKTGESKLSEDTFKNINAPAIIYPFIREHVSSLTLKAGIGNVLLPSVNFKI